MSRPAKSPIPEGLRSLTPMIVVKGALEAIDFYKRAFGAEELSRLVAPNGQLLHASLRIGDSVLMLTDECPPMGAFGPLSLGGSPVTVHISVPDVDGSFARATSAGATPVVPPADMFWGARYGVLKDPYGHSWSVATQVLDLTQDEIAANFQKSCAAQAA